MSTRSQNSRSPQFSLSQSTLSQELLNTLSHKETSQHTLSQRNFSKTGHFTAPQTISQKLLELKPSKQHSGHLWVCSKPTPGHLLQLKDKPGQWCLPENTNWASYLVPLLNEELLTNQTLKSTTQQNSNN